MEADVEVARPAGTASDSQCPKYKPAQSLRRFHDASSTLDSLRKDPKADSAIIREYEALCSEIEGEVIEICLLAQNNSR